MINFINNTLSYDFIPNLFEVVKHMAIYSAICLAIVIIIALLAYASKNDNIRNIISNIGAVSLGIFIILLAITIISLVLIPTLFCIVSIKDGLIQVFNLSELLAGFISAFFCTVITVLLINFIVFDD